MQAHPEVDVVINFSSFRSAYESSLEALSYPQIRCLAVIAEGIPESLTRLLNQAASDKEVVLIGPATVGGIKPGCFKIGNTGGSMDNIISSKLYRPGSVAYVSRSGGMSNELNNIISRTTDGVYEGVAIGGDRYPGTTFIDHLRRYQADPAVKLLVLLGEVGGVEEYEICEAMKSGALTKPMVRRRRCKRPRAPARSTAASLPPVSQCLPTAGMAYQVPPRLIIPLALSRGASRLLGASAHAGACSHPRCSLGTPEPARTPTGKLRRPRTLR